MERYLCIHGHFYQPPRENPWLEAIELQDAAYPYHDWNERIHAECYAANAASRILDAEGRIERIVNNYAKISFDFGPTLLSWMAQHGREAYEAILQADRESRERFGGHGSAIAQAYNHMILPLANRRDKACQVRWGIRDFRFRFGRDPEGMWLPETAVDLETLEILAEQGIAFTILAPSQAQRVRPPGGRWREVSGERVDPTRAYEVPLPSGRSIAVFFYDGPVSRGVAFERLLHSGEAFARRLLEGFSDKREWPQLMHIATDGETYGHHHRFGDMALAYALHLVESNRLATLTNYGAYLERHPPAWQAEIVEGSSWSCAHGVERWRADCGCHGGGHPGWNQTWRRPLRQALDGLRDALAPRYEAEAAKLLRDPWRAREDYIDVILDRSPESRERFLHAHAQHPLSGSERVRVWKLLEMQRHAMLMYTSCGWFFDDLCGIETVQIVRYAARALQLAQELFHEDFESRFLAGLEAARSNVAEHGNGRDIYRKFVRPAMVDLTEVGAHYAVSSLFESVASRETKYAFVVEQDDVHLDEAGSARLALGRIRVTSIVTEEQASLSFGVLHFGDHNLTGGARPYRDEAAYRAMVEEVREAFSTGELPEVVRRLDRHFQPLTFSLRSLFRDEQRRVLERLLRDAFEDSAAVYRKLYDGHAAMMRFLASMQVPLPRPFRLAAEFVVHAGLREAVQANGIDGARLASWLRTAREFGLELDAPDLGLATQRALEREMERLREQWRAVERIEAMRGALRALRGCPFEVNLWRVQNLYDQLAREALASQQARAREGDEDARRWLEAFRALGEALHFRVSF